MTPSIEEKAAAIVAGRRLTVEKMNDDGLIVARCLSSDGLETYALGFDPTRREWRCTCPTPRRRACSHLAALRLVVDEPEPKGN